MKKSTVERLTEKDFEIYSDLWEECLDNSSADPIFSSWNWCYSWWVVWSKIFNLELNILIVKNNEKLIGIAPLYSKNISRNFGPKGRQLQVIGSSWRIGPSVRTEHTGFILRKGYESVAIEQLRYYLKNQKWKDLIVSDHDPAQIEMLRTFGVSITNRTSDRGVLLDVTGDFDLWIKSLGKNTRLKVYNRRNYLKGRIKLKIIDASNKAERNEFFGFINKYNKFRRDEELSQYEIEFHNTLAEYSNINVKPVYSLLLVDNLPVSAVYDIQSRNNRYNLLSVFQEDFDKKVSLGLLHLGYMVEEAFKSENIKIYDFLAGEGKNSFYKERLKGANGKIYDLITSQISRTLDHYIYLKVHMLLRTIYNYNK